MRWFRVQNFYDSWRPVYIITRFFCLTTVTTNFVDRTSVRTSTDHAMLIVGILMCTLLAYNCFELYQEQKFTLTESYLISGGMFAYLIVLMSSVISVLVLNYVHGDRAAKFFDIIQRADQQISSHFGYRWNYQREHLHAVVYFASAFLLQLLFVQLLSLSSPSFSQFQPLQLIRMVSAFSWVMGCYQTLASTTILQLTTIGKRFAVLNTKMEDNLDGYAMNPRRKIRQIALTHAMLSDTIRLFNTCFSKQITFAMGCGFMFNLFAIFALIHAYAATTADSATYSVARSNMLFSEFFQSFIFQLVVFSNRLNYECKRCSIIAQKAVSYGQYDRTFVRECKMFSQQLMHHSPCVSSGLFDFDWTLCYTMIGSLATYLVILLQFDFVNFNMHAEKIH
ncbi:AAEL017364-PA, partial [Aedes aegypti]